MEADDDIMLGMLNNEGGGSFINDPEEATQELAKEIHAHMSVLKASLPVSRDGLMVSSTQTEGFLWTQKNNSRWKKRWFVWRYSDVHEQWNMYAYKSRDTMMPRKLADKVPGKVKSILRTQNDDPNAKSMIKVTFAHKEEFTKKQQEANLEAMQQKDEVPTSKTFLRVFSRKNVFSLAAIDDEEVSRWEYVLSKYLKDLLGSSYDQNLVVAQTVGVLLQQQFSEYLKKCQELMKAMEKSGFFDDDVRHKRDKSGTLWLESNTAEDGWTKHRFILQGRALYHYPSNRGHSAKRMIPLKFATVEHNSEQGADGECIFQITTPLISYVVKAKHQVSMEEWINAIERNKNRPKLSAGEKITEGVKGVAAALANLQIGGKHLELFPDAAPLLSTADTEGLSPKVAMLVVRAPESKKEKTYSIKKASMKIGRSSTNEIVVEDSRLSREHASIDTVGDKLVFSDLGSKRGSKINRVRVTNRVVLQAGDNIKVGKTHITVLRK